ncbi:unnamed protein product, partial [Oikopleura dioica]
MSDHFDVLPCEVYGLNQ